MLHNNSINYQWEISEFQYQEKKKNWYWIVGLVALGLIVGSIIMENYLLGFIILLATFLIMTQANRQPLDMNIEISQDGINLHDKMHRYDDIEAFWIKETKDNQIMLILLTTQKLTPLESVIVPEEINPLELREYLLEFIEERELRQSYTEQLIHLIGF